MGEVIKGNGIRANVDGHILAIGNRKLMNAENIDVPTEVAAYAIEREKSGNTAIFAAVDGKSVESSRLLTKFVTMHQLH